MSEAPDKSLAGLVHWTTLPATAGALIGAALVTAYALFTLELPPGAGLPLVLAVAVITPLTVLNGYVTQRRALREVLEVEKLGAGAPPKALRAAARSLFAFPDRCFMIFLSHWTAASLLICVAFGLASRVSPAVALRTGLVALAIGPLATLLSYLSVLVRVRVAIGRVAAGGLSMPELIRIAPPVRLQLRRRWLVFTAICVVTPTLLIADLVFQRAERTVEAVLKEPTAQGQWQVLKEREGQGRAPALVLGLLVLGVVVAVAYLSGGSLEQPMREITREAGRIAAGDLRSVSVIVAEDEVWAASAAFATMQAQLTGAISELKRAGLRIGTTTEELLATSGKHEQGAEQQVIALSQTSTTTEELARSARHIAGNAQDVAQMAEQTLSAAQTGMASAASFTSSMGRTREGNQAIADSVVKLNKRVQQIGKIVSFINEIADKSDLLALNAELEGTKAGEVGRGFSLVAAEMRRLAESVMTSTREISRLIDEIRDATNAAVMATEAGVKATDRGIALSNHMTQSLESIHQLARETADAVRSISLATHQQQTATDQLAEAMVDILQSTQQGSLATREVATANADLSTLARDLRVAVERFTL